MSRIIIVGQSFSKGDYEGYLAKYPKGLHASQARTEINKKKKLEDENYWAACLKSGDYKLYLENIQVEYMPMRLIKA